MRQVSVRPTLKSIAPALAMTIAMACSLGATGHAQQATNADPVPPQPIIVPSQSSVYNQNSVFLPTPPTVSGQDIVRGADGSSCQSAIASGGPYVDMGVIGSQDFFERNTAALYGRVVVPIGRRAKRIDCSRLYELEVNRMRMELELLRMGTMMPTDYPAAPDLVAAAAEMERPAPTTFAMTDDNTTSDAAFTVNASPPPLSEAASIIVTDTEEPALARVAAPPSVTPAAPPITVPREPIKPEVAAAPSAPATVIAGPVQDFEQSFAQLGAFSSARAAHARLGAVAGTTSRRVVPVERNGRTLHRALIGPLSLQDAAILCARYAPDCIIISADRLSGWASGAT